MSNIKVRIAPSPTGFLHIGTARTALFNWLFAKHFGGEFILRIEDTDLERSDKKYEKDIVDGLKWLGLRWDNKKIIRQSERLSIYRKHLERLLEIKKAFWCHHSLEELAKEKESQNASKEPQRHLCEHKNSPVSAQRIEGGVNIIRLNVPWESRRKLIFDDRIRGHIESEERLLGDISLAKDLDTPLYNFAVVVDDFEMGITDVIRGEDHISNTPKQILIYEALNQPIPKFAHLPLILAPDRSKLSKRHGAVSVDEYSKDYLPEALVNFIGFIGFTYSKEIMTLEDMASEFDLGKVHRSGAIFDIKKLNWINTQYVKRLDAQTFKKLAKLPRLPDAAIPLVTERLERLSDAKELFDFFWKKPKPDTDMLRWKDATSEDTKRSLEKGRDLMERWDFEDKQGIRSALDEAAQGNRGAIYWPLRVVLSGKKASPDPVDIAFILGKKEVLARLDVAIKHLTVDT